MQICYYIGDILLMGQNEQEVTRKLEASLRPMPSEGWNINFAKNDHISKIDRSPLFKSAN